MAQGLLTVLFPTLIFLLFYLAYYIVAYDKVVSFVEQETSHRQLLQLANSVEPIALPPVKLRNVAIGMAQFIDVKSLAIYCTSLRRWL